MSYNDVKSFLKKNKEPENYNFEFECDVDDYNKLPLLERYLIYKATSPDCRNSVYPIGKKFAIEKIDKKYQNLGDPDGCGKGGNKNLIYDVYSILWGWKEEDGNENNFGNIQDNIFNCQFGGDTMNSVQNALNSITKKSIEEKKEENKPLLDRKIGRDYSINYLIELFAVEECKEKLLSILTSVNGLCDYIDAYHTIGNFILVPSGFNRGRSKKTNDYWDLSLDYLKTKGWKSDFNCDGKKLNDYNRYINYFFLWDYVDTEGEYKPLLKREADSLEENEPSLGKYKPRIEDFEQFLKKANILIKRRGCFMIAMLRLQQILGNEVYSELRNGIFVKNDAVYSSYNCAFESVKNFLKDNITDEINNLLSEAEKKINLY